MLAEKEQLDALAEQFDLELDRANLVQTLSEAELIETLPRYDGWIAGDDPGTSTVLERAAAGKLRAVVKWGIGIDNIDVGAITRLSLDFANTPGMFSDEVADLALGYLIALARHILPIDSHVRQGEWIKPQGTSLAGKCAGIVGMGNIGKALGTRLRACGLDVIGYDPMVDNPPGATMCSWPENVEKIDYLFLCCALTPDNRHMIDEEVITNMKESSLLINVSRGPLVDEPALTRALVDGRIAGAALDVFESEPLTVDSPLVQLDRVILGSHNASNTKEAVRATNERAVALLAEMLH